MEVYALSIIYLLIMLFIYLHIELNLAKAIIIVALSFSSFIQILFNIFLCEKNGDGVRAKKLLKGVN